MYLHARNIPALRMKTLRYEEAAQLVQDHTAKWQKQVCLLIWPHCAAGRVLVLLPGIKPVLSTVLTSGPVEIP